MRDYRHLLLNAQKWIQCKYSNFDPLIWEEKKAAYTRRKAFAELAIYAYVLNAGRKSNFDNELNQFIIDIANSDKFHQLLYRSPRQILLYSAPIAYAIALKQATSETVACLDNVIKCPQAVSVERSAHRLMDLWQFLTLVERCPNWLSAKEILQFSCLSHQPSAFDCTLSEAYALTHNVLFLKNFGVRDPRFKNSWDIELNQKNMSLIIARFMYEENSDVVLELTMALGLLGQLNGDDCRLILDWIKERNGNRDYIAGPRFDPDSEIKYSGLDQEWVTNYHTTLVAISMLLLTEKYGWLSNKKPPALFDTTIEDVIRWGEAISLINRYEIPKAIAIIDSVNNWTDFSKSVAQITCKYLRGITNNKTGLIGYWVDEIAAEKLLNEDAQIAGDLQQLSNIAKDVFANIPTNVQSI